MNAARAETDFKLSDDVLAVLQALAEGGPQLEDRVRTRAQSLVDGAPDAGAVEEPVAGDAIENRHETYLDQVRDLAAILAVVERTREAEILAAWVHAQRQDLVQDWTLATGTDLRVLAEICRREGRSDEAIKLLLKAKRSLAGDQAQTLTAAAELARTINDLALMFQRTGRLTQAAHEMKRAVELFTLKAEDNAEDTRAWHELGVAWSNLGVIYGALKKSTAATDAFLKALDRLSPGQEPHRFAQVLHNLGVHLGEQGQAERGLDLLEQALAVRQQCLAEDDLRLCRTMMSLARVAQITGDGERALSLARDAFARAKPQLASSDPELQRLRAALTEILEAHGLLEESARQQSADDFDVC